MTKDQQSSAIDLEELIHNQLNIMDLQLTVMGQMMSGSAQKAGSISPAVQNPIPENIKNEKVGDNKKVTAASETQSGSSHAQPAGRRALKKTSEDLTPRQQSALNELIQKYSDKTRKSKQLTDEWRSVLADNRSVAGFNLLWKEMVYQIVCDRSLGSKIWDVDGNEYLDITLSFGAVLLGHSPQFIVKAVEEQLQRGFEVGLQNALVGDVCNLICELTGNERVTFSHSGCEAVQYATRIARTVTGRDKVVMFVNDIHGRGDLVLGRTIMSKNGYNTIPSAAGVPKQVVDHAIVLQYGTEEALSVIREQADQLAAVLVEPVRTRNPDLQPVEFLKELRQITHQSGALLIFDEVVMGFRVNPGGAQGYFDIRADLVTYGKALGGGMPIGAVAGKAEYIDVIDGGRWCFGDGSLPEVGMTVAGGTMVKHPLAMAAARAFLSHIKSEGPSLQKNLGLRTSKFVKNLNEYFKSEEIPIYLEHFSSYFLPKFTGDQRFEGLFYCYLRNKGVHVYLDYPCFLSTAHTDDDIAFLTDAFKSSAREMMDAGFLS